MESTQTIESVVPRTPSVRKKQNILPSVDPTTFNLMPKTIKSDICRANHRTNDYDQEYFCVFNGSTFSFDRDVGLFPMWLDSGWVGDK
mmetsp:Transcript_19122/g.52476  ORF Transcript_19122/g.52476 Transcript_19122/m.52476 type:complete len:88 (-) Transcript_19122:618-881(-)